MTLSNTIRGLCAPQWTHTGRPDRGHPQSSARRPTAVQASCSGHQPEHGFNRRQLLSSLSASSFLLASCPAEAASSGANVQNFASLLEQRVEEVKLPNGLKFLVLRRANAPVVSCHTHANVGAFDEITGQTGMAHLLEHMAFKGTQRVGTRDYIAEAPLLEALDEAFYELREAQAGSSARSTASLAQHFVQLQRQAGELSVSNGYGALLSRAGAVGLNASTSHDATKFYISLPSNKLELWFALEAERFQAPVFRELYTEKQVVAEERRSRIDNSPLGRYQEAFAHACLTNNYGRPVIGYPEDVANVGRRELQTFFEQHYGPAALTIAIVGDVTLEQVDRLAQKYFGDWQQPTTLIQAAPEPALEALPRPSAGPMRFDGASSAGPALLQAFYRPNMKAKESTVVDVVSDLLSGSRLSRLYSNLVQQEEAYSAVAIPGWPGEKHASALLISALPTPKLSLEQLDAAIHEEVDALAASGPSPAELQRIKKAAKFAVIDAISSNSSMASGLATYEVLTGSWRNVVSDLGIIDSLTAEDIRSVAAETFAPGNCFTGYVQPLKA